MRGTPVTPIVIEEQIEDSATVDGKQDLLVTGVNIATINGHDLLAGGDILVGGGTFSGTMDDITDGATYVKTENNYTDAEVSKLAGISTGATANSSDATLLARANHTGTQTASTISDFTTAAQTAAPAETGATIRTALGTTTVGANINTLANPSAVRWLRVNADNSVTPRTAAETLSDIGAQAAGTYATGTGTASGTNTGDQTSIVGITGTIAQFNTACTDADFATGGGTATGTNTGDQTSIVGISGTIAQFNTACSDADFATGGGTATGTNTGDETGATIRTKLGTTTAGASLNTVINPSVISFPRINADNSCTTRTPAQVLSDIGAQASGSYLTASNIVGTITNGNTTTAPNEDIVYDALSNKSQANSAEFSQAVVSGTAYYVTGSSINIPVSTLQVGSSFTWRMWMSKTAAGTGTFQMRIYRGTNGSTADTADVTQTLGTQTAVVDSMVVDITISVTATGATGSYFWTICPMNKAVTATGFGIATGTTGLFSGTVSSVALNTANLKFGISFIATTGTPTVRVAQIVKSS